MTKYSARDWVWASRPLHSRSLAQEIANDFRQAFLPLWPPDVDYYRPRHAPLTRREEFDSFVRPYMEAVETLLSRNEWEAKERFLRRALLWLVVAFAINAIILPSGWMIAASGGGICLLALVPLYLQWHVPRILTLSVPAVCAVLLVLAWPMLPIALGMLAVLHLYLKARSLG